MAEKTCRLSATSSRKLLLLLWRLLGIPEGNRDWLFVRSRYAGLAPKSRLFLELTSKSKGDGYAGLLGGSSRLQETATPQKVPLRINPWAPSPSTSD